MRLLVSIQEHTLLNSHPAKVAPSKVATKRCTAAWSATRTSKAGMGGNALRACHIPRALAETTSGESAGPTFSTAWPSMAFRTDCHWAEKNSAVWLSDAWTPCFGGKPLLDREWGSADGKNETCQKKDADAARRKNIKKKDADAARRRMQLGNKKLSPQRAPGPVST